MIIGPPESPVRSSQVSRCVEHAPVYGLTRPQAREVVDRQLATIEDHWEAACDEARLAAADRAMFRRVFPAAYALEGYARAGR